MADMADNIEALRDYLRQPEHRISPTDPESRHQSALQGIWEHALKLTNGDRGQALYISVQATRSSRQPGESEDDKTERLGGVPSRAFGSAKDLTGEDKPQHFFAAATVAYIASIRTMHSDPTYDMTFTRYTTHGQYNMSPPPAPVAGELFSQVIGRAYEVKDWVKSPVSDVGGYSRGDIHADDRGAAFGAALAASLITPDRVNPNAPPINVVDYLGARDDSDSTRDPISPLLDKDTAFHPDAGAGRDTSPAGASGSAATSTPADANYLTEQGQAMHVGAGGSGATSTPADANYLTEQGQAVHEGSPPDSGDNVFDDMVDDTY